MQAGNLDFSHKRFAAPGSRSACGTTFSHGAVYGIICGEMNGSFPDWRIRAAATTDDTDAKGVTSAPRKRLYLIAGANGSGKSTIARVLLPTEGVRFVNPDDIARELNPDAPEHAKIAAGREALHRIDEFFDDGESFAIETTLSGIVHVKTLRRAKELGYGTTLIYVFVDSAEICIARIAARVRNGGHYIPDADVRRRYGRSKRNFLNVYAPLVDQWTLIYNGSAQADMVARKDAYEHTTIFSESLYDLFKEGL